MQSLDSSWGKASIETVSCVEGVEPGKVGRDTYYIDDQILTQLGRATKSMQPKSGGQECVCSLYFLVQIDERIALFLMP